MAGDFKEHLAAHQVKILQSRCSKTLRPYIMKTSLPIAKINGKVIHGQAHIQPGVNNWIGVCIIPDDFFEVDFKNGETIIIEYEGSFNCRKYRTNGKGKAKILSVSPATLKNKLIVNFEGIEEPILERGLEEDLKYSYNENLPVYINNLQRKEITNKSIF